VRGAVLVLMTQDGLGHHACEVGCHIVCGCLRRVGRDCLMVLGSDKVGISQDMAVAVEGGQAAGKPPSHIAMHFRCVGSCFITLSYGRCNLHLTTHRKVPDR
jgi:hypothetical protein